MPTNAATTNAADAAPEIGHAEQNANGWLETIREYAAALDADRDRLEELRDARDNFSYDELADLCAARSVAPESLGYSSAKQAWAGENPEDAAELAELEAAVTIDGEELDEDALRERIEESTLSVQVRDEWYSPGSRDEIEGPSEYCILLSTGGPALRIVGDLDQHCEPTSARLEYQDWGTPWTERICTGDDHAALTTFVGCFYFGG